MRKSVLIIGTSLLVGMSFTAFARGGGGFGNGNGGNFAGSAAGRASNEAAVNSNGSFAGDRDKGLQRAEDRRSSEGANHEKAQENRMHRNGKHAQKH